MDMDGNPYILLAYIDPGSAGFVIVSVLGFLSAVGYMARDYIHRMKRLLFRSANAAPEDTGQIDAQEGQRGDCPPNA